MSGSSSTQWIDTHCHIHDHDDAEGTLVQARAAGVSRLICIGTDAARSAAKRRRKKWKERRIK